MAERSVFECGICSQRFNETDRVPMSLPCGHVFCKLCLSRVDKCPIDGSSFILERLPCCYAILGNLSSSGGVPCSRHPRKRVKFVCKLHTAYLCSDCVLDHTGKGHEVLSFTPNIEQMREEVNELFRTAEEIRNKVRNSEGLYKQTSKKLSSHFEGQIAKVKANYDACIKQLTVKRKEYVDFFNCTQRDQLMELEIFAMKNSKNLDAALEMSDNLKEFSRLFMEHSYEEFVRVINAKREELSKFNSPSFETKYFVFNDNVEVRDNSSFNVLKSESNKTDFSSSMNTAGAPKKLPTRKPGHNNKHKQRTLNREKSHKSI